jgi:hypothetical protein
MKIKTLRKESKFIPEFDGNKDLKPAEQVVVNIKKFPGNEDLGKIKAFKMDASGNMLISYDNKYILKNFIGSIAGIELDEGIEKVTNGSSLSSSTVLELEPLIAEIRDYLLETVEVLDEKENKASV